MAGSVAAVLMVAVPFVTIAVSLSLAVVVGGWWAADPVDRACGYLVAQRRCVAAAGATCLRAPAPGQPPDARGRRVRCPPPHGQWLGGRLRRRRKQLVNLLAGRLRAPVRLPRRRCRADDGPGTGADHSSCAVVAGLGDGEQ